MTDIRLDNLRKSFGDFVAVKGSSFTVDDGCFFVMLGPSGCGKTTTLRMIAGLELPSDGRIMLGAEEVTYRRASERDIAFVFQLFALYPHLNVRRNIGFPLLCQGVPRAEITRRVDETARLLRIDHLLNRRVGNLSSGDRQRVALGRSLVRRPQAFLMDEPLGALDSELRHVMCEELRALHDRVGATTVYVTHDQLEAMALADRIAVMNHGVVEQIGPPQDIYDRPMTKFVAGFIGWPPMNFLVFHGALAKGERHLPINGGMVSVPELREDRSEDEFALGVRPEHIVLDDQSPLRGRVFGVEYLGTTQIVTIDTEHGQLKVRLSASLAVRTGETVGLALRSERLSLFDNSRGTAIRTALHDEAHHG
jgi:multiple sugar transport system ATP-binding protein